MINISNSDQVFEFKLICEFLKRAIQLCPNANIISIVTGNGYFEQVIECILQIKIQHIRPDLNNINSLSNCILILNMTDITEAILSLNPKCIIWIGETNNSFKFHDLYNITLLPYKIVLQEMKGLYFDKYGDLIYTITLFVKLDKPNVLENNDLSNYLSNGVQAIMLHNVENYVEDILKMCDYTWISVGSGNSVLEKHLYDKYNLNMICVDPKLEQYFPAPKTLEMETKYDYVKDLINNNSKIIGTCILLLNWSNPGDSEYDMEAIELLNPKFILWIGEKNGAAGGEKFHKWLHECENNNTNYTIIQKFVKAYYFSQYGILYYTMMILEKNHSL